MKVFIQGYHSPIRRPSKSRKMVEILKITTKTILLAAICYLVASQIRNIKRTKFNPKDIIHMPEEYITLEMAEQVVTYDGGLLYKIPVNLRTHKICMIALLNAPYAILDVPRSVVDFDICTRAVEGNQNIIAHLPAICLTEEIYKLAVSMDGNLLFLVPYEEQTVSICKAAVENNRDALKFVRNDLIDLVIKSMVPHCKKSEIVDMLDDIICNPK